MQVVAEPPRFAQYQPRSLEISDSTLSEGQQTSRPHHPHPYFAALVIAPAAVQAGTRNIDTTGPCIVGRSGTPSHTALLINMHLAHDYDGLIGFICAGLSHSLFWPPAR
jgi:hypothetical protein